MVTQHDDQVNRTLVIVNIVLIEPNFCNDQHFMVNRGFLKAHLLGLKKKGITLFGDAAHISAISDGLDEQSLDFRYLDIKKETQRINRNSFNYYLAPFKRLWMYLKILRQFKATRNLRIFLFSHNEFDLFCANFLSRVFETRFYIVCHSNLNELYSWQSRNPIRRLFQYKTAISRIASSNNILICLEKHIQLNLLKILPEIEAHVIHIPHPIDKLASNQQVNIKNKKVLGFIGKLSDEKNPQLFIELSKLFPTDDFAFHFIGWTPKHNLDYSNCEMTPEDSPLAQKVIDERIKSCDFICIFHDRNFYDLSASGIFLDAIKYTKPILHLNLPFILNQEEMFGKISVGADDIGSLADSLKQIDDFQIRDFHKNLRSIREQRTPECVSRHLALMYES
jgi:glycosyltransferase involved in cell wall biosynthesis